MRIPANIRAGDTARWRDDATSDVMGNAITSATHSLTYYVRGGAGQAATLTGTADQGGWLFAFTPSLAEGTYYWQAVAAATAGGEKTTLSSGQLQIDPSLAYTGTAAAFDGRSQAEKDLAAVQAAIRAMVSGGAVAEYTIGNRRLKKMELPDLMALEAKLKGDVVRERKAQLIANGMGNPHNLYVRFRG